MTTVSLQDARQAVVRDRVLEGVATLLRAGEDLTFAKVAVAADVPERTVYRHFPTREALLTAVYEWANQQAGFDGARATNAEEAIAAVRRAFPAFDELAPIVRTLMLSPDGLAARLSENEARRSAATHVVRHEAPDLDEPTTRRVAAVIQLLSSAAAWQSMHDYWGLDGTEAAECSALAIDLVLTGAKRTSRPSRQKEAPIMTMLDGVNHVAVLTADLDRFIAFYRDVFELDVVFEETTETFRHAILRTGAASWIHPAEVHGNAHADALPAMFERGHLDHVALGASSPAAFDELRRRLLERDATDGIVEDLGPFQSLWFRDPDGMNAELTVIVDDDLTGIHAPQPLDRDEPD